jgi:hypothetical protein
LQWNVGTILNFDTVGKYVLMIKFVNKTFTSLKVTEKLSVIVG